MWRALLLVLFPMFSYAANWQQLTELLPDGSHAAIIIDNGNSTFASSANVNFAPASTQKVLTSVVSTLILGDDFRFQTQLATAAGQPPAIVWSGDPTLSRNQVVQLLKQLHAQQKSVDVIRFVTPYRRGYDMADGWGWNDLPLCFSAPVGDILIDKNCVYAKLMPDGSVQKAANLPIEVTSSVAWLNQSGCQLNMQRGTNNHFHLYGCWLKPKDPIGLAIALANPAQYAADLVRYEWQRLGGQGQLRVEMLSYLPEGYQVVSHVQSAPLRELRKTMMMKSDNTIAEALFRAAAYGQLKRPVTFQDAADVMRSTLTRFGMDLKNAQLTDGSGLSRHNALQPKQMFQLLQLMQKDPRTTHLFKDFPVAGMSGSLGYRRGFTQEPIKGNVAAKTGALKGVYNLAGFITTKDGTRRNFVLFISGYVPDKPSQRTNALAKFNEALFKALVNGERLQ